MKVFMAMLLFLLAFTISKADSDALEVLKHVRRVIGDREITDGDWPWLVHLAGKIPNEWIWGVPTGYANFYCTGSVISRRWVLTTADCFYEPDAPSGIKTPKYWHATIGEIERRHSVVDEFWAWFDGTKLWYKEVSEIHIYPSYTSDDWRKHDVALVKVGSDIPISYGAYMGASVVLPTQDTTTLPKVGQSCVMKVWGCAKDGGKLSSVAKVMELQVMDQSRCSWYGHSSETTICAGYDAKDIELCPGDSGSPLVCWYNGKWCQAGIAIYTATNQPSELPAIFTRVSHYRDWIIKTVGKLGN